MTKMQRKLRNQKEIVEIYCKTAFKTAVRTVVEDALLPEVFGTQQVIGKRGCLIVDGGKWGIWGGVLGQQQVVRLTQGRKPFFLKHSYSLLACKICNMHTTHCTQQCMAWMK